MSETFSCPHCSNDIEITEVMSAQLETSIRAKLESQYADKNKTLVADRKKLVQLQTQLEAQQEEIDQRVKEAVAKQSETISIKARVEAQQAVAVEIKDRDLRLKEADKRLEVFEQKELELRKRTRELEQKTMQQELENARQLDEERKTISDAAFSRAQEENRLKQAEKDQTISAMLKQIDELKRKGEQGSQQLQGEVQELALEILLAEQFPNDVILPVAKGVRGADVLQRVVDRHGRECGSILWESKRTKNWNDKWLSKVCDDQQEAKASCACIVSAILPESIQHFGEIGDVWVTNFSCVRSVAVAIRRGLIETAQIRRATEGQQGKMEVAYEYLFGKEFRNRVRGLIEPLIQMQADLEEEKRALQTRWNRRHKQLDRVMASTTGLYGDLQGIIGNGMQAIEGMDMLALEDKQEADQVIADQKD